MQYLISSTDYGFTICNEIYQQTKLKKLWYKLKLDVNQINNYILVIIGFILQSKYYNSMSHNHYIYLITQMQQNSSRHDQFNNAVQAPSTSSPQIIHQKTNNQPSIQQQLSNSENTLNFSQSLVTLNSSSFHDSFTQSSINDQSFPQPNTLTQQSIITEQSFQNSDQLTPLNTNLTFKQNNNESSQNTNALLLEYKGLNQSQINFKGLMKRSNTDQESFSDRYRNPSTFLDNFDQINNPMQQNISDSFNQPNTPFSQNQSQSQREIFYQGQNQSQKQVNGVFLSCNQLNQSQVINSELSQIQNNRQIQNSSIIQNNSSRSINVSQVLSQQIKPYHLEAKNLTLNSISNTNNHTQSKIPSEEQRMRIKNKSPPIPNNLVQKFTQNDSLNRLNHINQFQKLAHQIATEKLYKKETFSNETISKLKTYAKKLTQFLTKSNAQTGFQFIETETQSQLNQTVLDKKTIEDVLKEFQLKQKQQKQFDQQQIQLKRLQNQLNKAQGSQNLNKQNQNENLKPEINQNTNNQEVISTKDLVQLKLQMQNKILAKSQDYSILQKSEQTLKQIQSNQWIYDQTHKALAWHNMGLAQSKLTNYSQALQYDQQALQHIKILYDETVQIKLKALNKEKSQENYQHLAKIDQKLQAIQQLLFYQNLIIYLQAQMQKDFNTNNKKILDTSEILFKNLKLNEAIELIEASLHIWSPIVRGFLHFPTYIQALRKVGTYYLFNSQLQLAIQKVNEGLKLMQKPQASPFEINMFLILKAKILLEMADYQQALECCKSGLAFFHTNLHFYDKFETHNLMGQIYHKIKDYTSANQHYIRAFSIFTVLQPEGHLLNVVLKNFGALLISQGDFTSAISSIDTALKGLDHRMNPQLLIQRAMALRQKAKAFVCLNQYQQAELHFIEALQLLDEKVICHLLPSAKLYHDWAQSSFEYDNDYQFALQMAQNSLKIRSKKLSQNHPDLLQARQLIYKIKKSIADGWSNLSDQNSEIENSSDKIVEFQHAQQKTKGIETSQIIKRTMNLKIKASILFKEGQIEAAEQVYSSCLQIFAEHDMFYDCNYSKLLFAFSMFYLKNDKHQDALMMATNLKEVLQEHSKNQIVLIQAIEELVKVINKRKKLTKSELNKIREQISDQVLQYIQASFHNKLPRN